MLLPRGEHVRRSSNPKETWEFADLVSSMLVSVVNESLSFLLVKWLGADRKSEACLVHVFENVDIRIRFLLEMT